MLTRWFDHDRWRSFERLNRALDPWWAHLDRGGFPMMNIYDDGESFIARAELPGVEPADIEITATGNTLNIRGRRETGEAGENISYHRRERKSGIFRRAFTLPDEVDSGKVTATCKNGILEILLPRSEKARQRKIEVTS